MRDDKSVSKLPIVEKVFSESRKTYSYHRVSQTLKARGKGCGYHKTASLMKRLNLKPSTKRKFKLTTDSKHHLPIYTNVLNRDFKPSKMNQA